MNQAKLQTLLQTNDVLRADRVCAPKRFVKVFAVPAAKLRGAMVDVIEWTAAFKHAFQLPELAHVAARIERHFNIGPQTEANLIGLMVQIARDDVMTALTQFADESRADSSQASGYKNAHIRYEARATSRRR